MPAIRNSCVARGSCGAGTFAPVYTVPADRVFLLKDVRLSHYSPAMQLPGLDRPAVTPAIVTAYDLAVYVSLPGVVSIAFINLVGSTVALQGFEGWIALNAGDQVVVFTNNGTQYYWISGALLPTIP